MSKEQRIAVIKDVLDRIDQRNIAKDQYIDSHEVSLKCSINDQAQNIEGLESCTVCALGSMLLSHIRLYNAITIQDIGGRIIGKDSISIVPSRDQIIYPLGFYFTYRQLDMIEVAFERTHYSWNDLSDLEIDKCIDFTNGLPPKERLRKICENILVNDGEFIP